MKNYYDELVKNKNIIEIYEENNQSILNSIKNNNFRPNNFVNNIITDYSKRFTESLIIINKDFVDNVTKEIDMADKGLWDSDKVVCHNIDSHSAIKNINEHKSLNKFLNTKLTIYDILEEKLAYAKKDVDIYSTESTERYLKLKEDMNIELKENKSIIHEDENKINEVSKKDLEQHLAKTKHYYSEINDLADRNDKINSIIEGNIPELIEEIKLRQYKADKEYSKINKEFNNNFNELKTTTEKLETIAKNIEVNNTLNKYLDNSLDISNVLPEDIRKLNGLYNYQDLKNLDKYLIDSKDQFKEQIVSLEHEKKLPETKTNVDKEWIDLHIKGYNSLVKITEINIDEVNKTLDKGKDFVGSGYELKSPMINKRYGDEREQLGNTAYNFFSYNVRYEEMDFNQFKIDSIKEFRETTNSLVNIIDKYVKQSEKENLKETTKEISKVKDHTDKDKEDTYIEEIKKSNQSGRSR